MWSCAPSFERGADQRRGPSSSGTRTASRRCSLRAAEAALSPPRATPSTVIGTRDSRRPVRTQRDKPEVIRSRHGKTGQGRSDRPGTRSGRHHHRSGARTVGSGRPVLEEPLQLLPSRVENALQPRRRRTTKSGRCCIPDRHASECGCRYRRTPAPGACRRSEDDCRCRHRQKTEETQRAPHDHEATIPAHPQKSFPLPIGLRHHDGSTTLAHLSGRQLRRSVTRRGYPSSGRSVASPTQRGRRVWRPRWYSPGTSY